MTSTAAPRRSLLRTPWVAPIAVASVLALTVASQPLLATGDSNDLPDVTAEQLVAEVLQAEPRAMSGTVVHTARLGLPDLLFTGATGADPMSLLGGSSTLRVWTDGEQRSRVALLGSMSEYSVVSDGAEMWTYSSSENEAVRYSFSDADLARLEAMGEKARAEALARKAELPTPQEAATEALAKVEEFSSVVVDSQSTVAGRDVYQLIVTPDTDETLVDSVVLSIDGETHIPLRVQTFSTTDTTAPAVDISFTDVEFAEPNASVFDFVAPAGAETTEVVVPLPEADELGSKSDGHDGVLPKVTGTGWASVVEFANADLASKFTTDPTTGSFDRLIGSDEAQEMLEEFVPERTDGSLDMGALFDQLTTEVPEGRLLSSALLTVLMTDDGRVLVGAVPAETLRALA